MQNVYIQRRPDTFSVGNTEKVKLMNGLAFHIHTNNNIFCINTLYNCGLIIIRPNSIYLDVGLVRNEMKAGFQSRKLFASDSCFAILLVTIMLLG